MIDVSKLEDIEVEGIDTRDYPDFCDAFISFATIDNRKVTDSELDYINSKERDFVHEAAMKQLF